MGTLFSLLTEEDTEAGEDPIAHTRTVFEQQSWDWDLGCSAVEAMHSPTTAMAPQLTGFWEQMGLLIRTYYNQIMFFICPDFTLLPAFEKPLLDFPIWPKLEQAGGSHYPSLGCQVEPVQGSSKGAGNAPLAKSRWRDRGANVFSTFSF